MPTSPAVSAVLLSGGLDSAVLLGEEALRGAAQPIYVTAGLAWEGAERHALAALLAAWPQGLVVRPLVTLTLDMSDLYPAGHWAITGQAPGYHTSDEEVYLLGRNIVLLSKAAVYCAAAGIDRLVLGTLGHNPFPDATPEFRASMSASVSLGLGRPLSIEAPYAVESKAEVVRRGAALGLPVGLTLSCMNPPAAALDATGSRGALHCGKCSKCRERHDAFIAAATPDATNYVDRTFVDGLQ